MIGPFIPPAYWHCHACGYGPRTRTGTPGVLGPLPCDLEAVTRWFSLPMLRLPNCLRPRTGVLRYRCRRCAHTERREAW